MTDSVFGPRVRVSAGAAVSRSAILAGAEVGPGASVSDSIIGPHARLGTGCTLCTTVVRANTQVPAGAELVNQQYPSQ